MATIQPVFSYPVDVTKVFWETVTEADTTAPITVPGIKGAVGSFQAVGTWGSATAVLQASNDGTNWVTVQDVEGNAVSMTADGLVDISSAALYLRVSTSGGSSQDLDFHLVMRQ